MRNDGRPQNLRNTVTRDSLQNFELGTALATVWPSVRNGFL